MLQNLLTEAYSIKISQVQCHTGHGLVGEGAIDVSLLEITVFGIKAFVL